MKNIFIYTLIIIYFERVKFMKFENRIQRYHHLFTKTDKQIVDYIQNNDFDDTFSTINSLAYAIKTSPATITRFSNKLNYDNFQDLKFNLQQQYMVICSFFVQLRIAELLAEGLAGAIVFTGLILLTARRWKEHV